MSYEFIIGTIIGAFTGYFGGIVDEAVMRINDVALAFPSILLALVIISVLDSVGGAIAPLVEVYKAEKNATCMKKAMLLTLSVIPASMLIYWFNLDNKLIFYVIRPMLNKIYDGQKRDIRL